MMTVTDLPASALSPNQSALMLREVRLLLSESCRAWVRYGIYANAPDEQSEPLLDLARALEKRAEDLLDFVGYGGWTAAVVPYADPRPSVFGR